jgi:hypothetical protein
MGIPTLISTSTASNASSVAITSGIDSTYDEYMFVFTDIGPATEYYDFQFQCSIDSGSNYNVAVTSTNFEVSHWEDDSDASLAYQAGGDLAQGTGYQRIANLMGAGSDESGAGILHLFNPASTTYVKHFYVRFHSYFGHATAGGGLGRPDDDFTAGYFNTTSAIDAISFKMSSGNFDGVIQMYGIA